jgi:hypothetical protein
MTATIVVVGRIACCGAGPPSDSLLPRSGGRRDRATQLAIGQPAEGTLRPWYSKATGLLMVLFSDPEEARRARSGLLGREVSQEDPRPYESEEILRTAARLQEERSLVAKAVAALVADPSVKQHVLVNARTGGAAPWVFARTRHRADHLVGQLADYHYSFLRHYGEEGVADVQRDGG